MARNKKEINARDDSQAAMVAEIVGEKEDFDFSSYGDSGRLTSLAYSRLGPDKAGKGKPAGELNNITKGVSPAGRSGCIDVPEAIELMQMAYYNTAIVRSTIEMQTDFSNSKIHFRGAKGVSLKFFEKWYEKINGWSLAQQWFREWFRSGNVFVYRFDGKLDVNEFRRITRANVSEAAKNIPVKYIVLNPADMRCMGNFSFVNSLYGKMLSTYEVSRLKNPQTPEEKEFVASLGPAAREQIKKGLRPLIELKPEKLSAVFNGKQDYEAMAVPPYYGVLTDLNLKMELRAGDAVIARAIDYTLLLVTAGEKERSAKDNKKLCDGLMELFATQSSGRVIFSDYTTKAEFIIPDLKTIFGAAKYEAINEDLSNGLCNIFYSNDKFANSQVKIQLFSERLSQAREAYLRMFLLPEMKRIAEEWGFTSIPEVYFEEMKLKDQVESNKLHLRMYEAGLLTPGELVETFETFKLPDLSSSLESKKEFKRQRDDGLYEPILGGNKAETGRPEGTKAPKRVNVGPIGGNIVTSMDQVKETVKKIDHLTFLVESTYKEKEDLKRLSKKHKDLCAHVIEAISSNEEPQKWEDCVERYIGNPYSQPVTKIKTNIIEMGADLQLSSEAAILLYHSSDPQTSI